MIRALSHPSRDALERIRPDDLPENRVRMFCLREHAASVLGAGAVRMVLRVRAFGCGQDPLRPRRVVAAFGSGGASASEILNGIVLDCSLTSAIRVVVRESP